MQQRGRRATRTPIRVTTTGQGVPLETLHVLAAGEMSKWGGQPEHPIFERFALRKVPKMSTTKPKMPAGLAARGAGFWRRTVKSYDLSDSEVQLLAEACRTLDQLDALAEAVARDGATVPGSMGQTTVHPALGEARGQRQVLHKLLAALALPDLEDESAAPMPSPRQVSARRAAEARWAGKDTEAARRRTGSA